MFTFASYKSKPASKVHYSEYIRTENKPIISTVPVEVTDEPVKPDAA